VSSPHTLRACCPSLQGLPAPAFLSNVFSWDESRRSLIIQATTVELSGSLIVRGYGGIKESLYIGGDPNSGEASTEIAPGGVLIYAREDKPAIKSFTTQKEGYEPSGLTLVGGKVYLDEMDGDEPQQVAVVAQRGGLLG
jgi:hypothetical protein